ncbi:MAG: hypothetical protein NTV03_00955 [Candidatus Nomurabacteria bacterium]|nr:hypothetical protein [Candidatus Nomurabacteria bacterium]
MIEIPKPRRERIIVTRDKEGRILNSIPPAPYEGKGGVNYGFRRVKKI